MRVSTERLLAGAIDYAGIFPPARLDLAKALDHYLDYSRGPERAVVDRFVCSTSRLGDLASLINERKLTDALEVAAVGAGGTDRASWESSLENDAKAMNDFLNATGDACDIGVFEIRIPSNADIERCIRDLNGFNEVDVYAELPWDRGQLDAIAKIAETEWLGAKARTGGLDADAFPDAYTLGGFIRGCISLEVPFKLTAGLHHALPQRDQGIGANMHGFLNVLAGTAITLAEDLSQRELEQLLLDGESSRWEFTDTGVSWRGREASLEDIEEARSLFVSFGSCSVEEPMQELEALGLVGRISD
jgi:hypothetical protein